MTNVFAQELGIPLPRCCNLGSCCKGASPSTPYHQLLPRAVAGDDFARGFFSIMVPYATHAEAEQVVPGIVERTLKAAEKQEAFASPADVVFYRCRYQTEDNRCGVWEDRPQFCRDYPDTPFVVMAPGCAFEGWGKACKEKFYALKAEVSRLKELKTELDVLKKAQSLGLSAEASAISDSEVLAPETAYSHPYTKIDELLRAVHNTENLSLILSLTRLYVASPLPSVYFIRFGF
ncbi:YkgJ family cysteine cluster protein [Vampirovibrio chlorellavorus]|uniref:YkgJ family cysteine cluster protein n=1 Tax=Vampirovibrio chlorellavorus TaxID=758823 RepID=UPI0026EF5E2C|nr:hypothetical protein [Vampirovibrio chlorellavorus]